MAIFGAPQLQSSRRKTCAPTELFVGKLILNNFYLKHFFIQHVFLAALSPVNLLSRFNTLKYFKHYNLWRPLAPLLGKIDICAFEFFCVKFNSEQFLFKAFFDVIGIFYRITSYTSHHYHCIIGRTDMCSTYRQHFVYQQGQKMVYVHTRILQCFTWAGRIEERVQLVHIAKCLELDPDIKPGNWWNREKAIVAFLNSMDMAIRGGGPLIPGGCDYRGKTSTSIKISIKCVCQGTRLSSIMPRCKRSNTKQLPEIRVRRKRTAGERTQVLGTWKYRLEKPILQKCKK